MNFTLSLGAVLPIVLYMGLGLWLARRGFLSERTQSEMNKIVFSFLFPCLMFHNVTSTALGQVLNLPFLLTMIVLMLLTVLLVVCIVPRFVASRPMRGALMQAMIRGNSVIFALPVVSTISGPENTGLASLCVAVLVPLYNLICVVILESQRGEKPRLGTLVRGVWNNPIVRGALAGLAFKALGLPLLPALQKSVAELAGIVSPLALIMLGAGLRFSDALRYGRMLAWACLVKLVLIPLGTVLVVHALGFPPVAVTTAMAMTGVPTAVSSFVMAREMGADSDLAAQLVMSTTVVSVFTIFFWVMALSSLGWIG